MVDVQLGTHEHKTERVHTAGRRTDGPGVPAQVLVVQQGPQGEGNHQREQKRGEVSRGKPACSAAFEKSEVRGIRREKFSMKKKHN